jgi:hypothetical protein
MGLRPYLVVTPHRLVVRIDSTNRRFGAAYLAHHETGAKNRQRLRRCGTSVPRRSPYAKCHAAKPLWRIRDKRTRPARPSRVLPDRPETPRQGAAGLVNPSEAVSWPGLRMLRRAQASDRGRHGRTGSVPLPNASPPLATRRAPAPALRGRPGELVQVQYPRRIPLQRGNNADSYGRDLEEGALDLGVPQRRGRGLT